MALPVPEPACIDLWLMPVPDGLRAASSDELTALLVPGERERLGRFRFARDRVQFLIAHSALRRILSLYRPGVSPARWRFVDGRFGKPRLADEDDSLDFNLSHTEGMVAIAITGGAAVGVDVERRRPLHDTEPLFAQCLSDAESHRMRRFDHDGHGARFHETWTLKEAYLKACGVGLSRDLREVELVFDEHDALVAVRDRAGAAGLWRFVQVSMSDARLALAVAMPCHRSPPPEAGITIREYAIDGTREARVLPRVIRDVAVGSKRVG